MDVVRSPVLTVAVNSITSTWTLDCGAETSLIEKTECNRLGLTIRPTRQRAKWGDGKTWVHIVGEVHFTASRDHHLLTFEGLVVERGLDTPVLAGAPFLKQNDLSINFRSQTIYLGECCKVGYNDDIKISKHRRSAVVMRVMESTLSTPTSSNSPSSTRNCVCMGTARSTFSCHHKYV